jgi:glycerol dehydrogenase
VISTTFFPGRYIQGYNAIERLGPEIARLGKTGYLICSPSGYNKILPSIKDSLKNKAAVTVEIFKGESTEDEIARLTQLAKSANCDVVIGMGGGKVIDTAKAVASGINANLIIVPTIASTNAPCSAATVIYGKTGVIDRVIQRPRNPDVVLVDTRIIAESPVRFLVAGMGESLATWFEANACQTKPATNCTMTDSVGSMAAYALARLCYQTLLECGPSAKRACEAHIVTPDLDRIIETNTLSSGIGFESGGLAGIHGLIDGFMPIKETHNYPHGEQVAFCTLIYLYLMNKEKAAVDRIYSFCESVGLPTTLDGIGLVNIQDSVLTEVAVRVCNNHDMINHEPLSINKEMVIAAIKAADNEGKRRKSTLLQ